MKSGNRSASELLQGETWIRAHSLFMRRREALSEFIGAESERLFLTEGTFTEISSEPAKEPTISRKLASGLVARYQFPDHTMGQLHKKGCEKEKVKEAQVWFNLTRYSRAPSQETLEFVQELQATEELSDLIKRFGGFWLWILRSLSADALRARGMNKSLMFGTFEFLYLNESIYERMAVADVSVPEVTALFVDAMDECPCIGRQNCLFCGNMFIPTAWSFVDLRLGQRACVLCAQIASDGQQSLPWLGMPKGEISDEISFGLSLQRKLHQDGTLTFSEAPQYDSEIAFRKLRQHALSDEDFVKAFLTVALRPKEPQVRLVFGYWEHWLREIHGERKIGLAGLDGHACNSHGEKAICDYLFQHGIEHRREPKYSELVHDQSAALVRHFKGDFEIDGVVYEYAGMDGSVDYDKKLLVKLTYAEQLGLKVVVIKPGDLEKLNDIFPTDTPAPDWADLGHRRAIQ
jgi:hypothetical protein